MNLKSSIILLLILCYASFSSAQTKPLVSIADLSKHIGDTITVNVKIINAVKESSGETLLLVGKDFPNQTLTIFEFPSDDLYYDPALLKNLDEVRFVGKLVQDNGHLEIMVTRGTQILLTKNNLRRLPQNKK